MSVRALTAALLATLLAGCSLGDGSRSLGQEPVAPGTARGAIDDYTDRGDGCRQLVSAIGYADDLLVVLGQEEHQELSDAVRSRLHAVAGTVAVERNDLPSAEVLRQAEALERLAEEAAGRRTPNPAQVRALREYRREAAQMVLVCAGSQG